MASSNYAIVRHASYGLQPYTVPGQSLIGTAADRQEGLLLRPLLFIRRPLKGIRNSASWPESQEPEQRQTTNCNMNRP